MALPHNFVNGQAPALDATNMNEIEAAIIQNAADLDTHQASGDHDSRYARLVRTPNATTGDLGMGVAWQP